MYLEYYDLRRKSFELSPDSGSLFLSETHWQGLESLTNGFSAHAGLLVMTGSVGAGKTTLINALATKLEDSHLLCILSNPTLPVADFYRYLANRLSLPFDGNKDNFIEAFSHLLNTCCASNRKVLLIIDEAHALPEELFDEIRFLEDLSTRHKNVLCIFLIGQPELRDRLAEETMKPLRQKIGVQFHLAALEKNDVEKYINFRLQSAGRGPDLPNLFTPKAVECIAQATGGVPRLVNLLCDNALLTGFAYNLRQIDLPVIHECLRQLHLPGDEKIFTLPKAKTFWEKWLWPVVIVLLVVEAVLGWLAYKYGFFQYIRHLFQ